MSIYSSTPVVTDMFTCIKFEFNPAFSPELKYIIQVTLHNCYRYEAPKALAHHLTRGNKQNELFQKNRLLLLSLHVKYKKYVKSNPKTI